MKQTLQDFGARACAAALLLVGALPASAQQAQAPSPNGWEFTITPYLWAAGESGSVRIGQRIPSQNVDASFSDIASSLDWGVMAFFDYTASKYRSAPKAAELTHCARNSWR